MAAADVSSLHSGFPGPPADLWNFSPPRHLHTEQAGANGTSASPARPGGPALSKQQPGQLRHGPDPLSCSSSLAKDGDSSTERSCLDKSLIEWAQNQFEFFCTYIYLFRYTFIKNSKDLWVTPAAIDPPKWNKNIWRNVMSCDVASPHWHVNLMSWRKLRKVGCVLCFTPAYTNLVATSPEKKHLTTQRWSLCGVNGALLSHRNVLSACGNTEHRIDTQCVFYISQEFFIKKNSSTMKTYVIIYVTFKWIFKTAFL